MNSSGAKVLFFERVESFVTMFYSMMGREQQKGNGSWTPTTHTYTDAYIPGEKRGREHENQDHKGMAQECMTQECVHDVKNRNTGE